MAGRGVFPGSFDPLTVAHLAIARSARRQLGLDVVELVVSHHALAKPAGGHSPLDERIGAIAARPEPWLAVRATSAVLVADLAEEADACVVGADKLHQLLDLRFYDSADHRAEALARLPHLAVAPRAGLDLPDRSLLDEHGLALTVLEVAPRYRPVSSTAVRAGAHHWRA